MKHVRFFAGRWIACLMVLGLPGLLLAQEAPKKQTLQVADLFKIKRVADPQISPDGTWVAYTVTGVNVKKDKSESRIWMVPAAGGEAIPMTAEGYSASRPRWSPDGKYLSFLAAKNKKKTQVWTLNRLGGEAQRLTKMRQGVSSYAWSPDGKRLVLVLKDPKPEELKEKKAGEKKEKPKPWVIDRLQFKRDYAGYLDSRRTHLYVFTPGDTAATQITSGDFDDRQPAWSPDGKLIAFTSNRTENPDGNSNTDIWVVAADSPDKGKTLLQVTTNPGSDSSPCWSPDGREIAYVTVTEPDLIWYATDQLAVAPAKGGAPRLLTATLDRNVSAPKFSAGGKWIYFLLEDSGERHLARIALSGGKRQRPIAGARSVRSYALHGATGVAALISEPHLPPELFMLGRQGMRQLTKTNEKWLQTLRLAEVENIHFASKDGTEIEGFLFKPPGFAAGFRYPTLLRIHGGPVAQYDFRFNFEAQLFAAHGYCVVTVNPRGSSGYGKAFALAIWQDWGNKDYEDVMAGVDYAVAQGVADPERLGVGGWSYGGILTDYVITKTGRFKAAISGASEVLYVANYGHDHYQLQWEKELGLPWKNRPLWERLSPFNAVENITTPTLLMGGEKDWNVPVLNSEQLYQALRRLGRTTKLVVYPGEHHGIRRPSFRKDRLERYLKWYDKYVKGEPAATDGPGGR